MKSCRGRGLAEPRIGGTSSGTDWGRLLKGEFSKAYWGDLMVFVEEEGSLYPDSVYPPTNEVFRALELTWCEQTRVVIIGLIPTTTQVKRTGSASACRAGCGGPSRSSGSILSFAPMSR
jgi:uracil DNA glycosylase